MVAASVASLDRPVGEVVRALTAMTTLTFRVTVMRRIKSLPIILRPPTSALSITAEPDDRSLAALRTTPVCPPVRLGAFPVC